MPEVDQKLIKSAANIPGVKTALVNTINVYDILNCDKFIVAKRCSSRRSRRCTHNENCTRYHPEARYHRKLAWQGIANKKYTFQVAKDANKIEIAKAVVELFGVKVAKVNTMQR